MKNSKGAEVEEMKTHVEVDKSDFICLNKGDIKEFYKVGKVIKTGSTSDIRLLFHKTTGQPRIMKMIKKDCLDLSSQHDDVFIDEIYALR